MPGVQSPEVAGSWLSQGPNGCFRTRPKATAFTSLEFRTLHQPSNAVSSHFETSSPQLPVDEWSAVEAAVLLKNRCHLGCDGSFLLGTGTRVALPPA